MQSRREFLQTALAMTAGMSASAYPFPAAQAPGFAFDPKRDIIPAPRRPEDWPEFQRQLAAWREIRRRELRYSDALYQRPEFAWVTRCFCCGFLMMCDETFYDPRAGRYTVRSFLEAGRREFGGYDALVLWHAYPRIGLDDRNQFDFYRDMPGGLVGLRRVSEELHANGVKVFLDYNPWDTGTRRERQSDLDALVDLVKAVEADGLFLDTMSQGAADFRAKLDAVRPGVVLEGEGALAVERIHDHHLSWAQGFQDSETPGVLRNKWFERRHLQHQIKRWDHNHTGELHCAWMNGSGMMVWENVFGSWVGWSQRDRAILRSMLPMQRRYAPLFCGERWTPLVPTLKPEVYASLWEGEAIRLWTLVNRANQDATGPLLQPQNPPELGELEYYDLIAGRKLVPDLVAGKATLHLSLPARGIGCILAKKPNVDIRDFEPFLKGQQQEAAGAHFDPAFPARQTRLLPGPAGNKYARLPEGMVEIPAANVELSIDIRERECGFYESVPPAGHRLGGSYQLFTLRRQAALSRYALDLTPVTNEQFARFLAATRYQPRQPENFLKHWAGGQPPPGRLDHPVVYVDLEDARAYARWTGKRLPTEEEWQYAAQGPQGLRYPWGHELRPGCCNDGAAGGTTPVRQFPEGRSPFGCYDLCGNVWEWTESERSDGRTRFCIIKGGSFYRAKGSNWYMDGGPRQNQFAAKVLLMWPGLDRCATVGFRCAADSV
jgi:formylglycine-generating enzyme required for sulfatase activity